jgi:hypothetical protein
VNGESLWPRLAELPLVIEACEYERLHAAFTDEFDRITTHVRLVGAGTEGLGEDASAFRADGTTLHETQPSLPLAGEWTLAGFCEQVGGLALWPEPPEWDGAVRMRRWAFESAALDLALRQAGRPLADAAGRDVAPLTFVVSTRQGIAKWRDLYPGLRFKIDAEDDWTDETVAELAGAGVIDTVDLKGHYRGTSVDLAPDAELYRRVCEGFPDAWIEDAWVDETTRPVLEPHAERLTWDAPVHSVADAEALPFRPRCLNVKPSRFGSVRRLLEFHAWASERGIRLYAGGQFELGPGRGQAQYLASLFHPDAPNDVAPAAFNAGGPRPGLPTSPLTLRPRATGFLLEG